MAEPKKISFGFSKSSKPQMTKAAKPVEQVEYIDCLDGKHIKIKDVEEQSETAEMIIPLSTTTNKKNNRLATIINSVRTIDAANTTTCDTNQQGDLDSIAASELIEEANNLHRKKTEDNTSIDLPLQNRQEHNDEESTLDDYEAVPVNKFGPAMLRGMGWDPAKGIGKSEKIVATLEPKVRPRGMGLGVVLERSSTVAVAKNSNPMSKPEEELKVVKGAYVQVTIGSRKDMYGQIEGFNEETGRLILKLALGGTSVSFSEFMVKPVTKDEFTKNSRVLNATKYQEYKSNETRETSRHRQANGSNHLAKSHRSEKEERKRERLRSRSRSPTSK